MKHKEELAREFMENMRSMNRLLNLAGPAGALRKAQSLSPSEFGVLSCASGKAGTSVKEIAVRFMITSSAATQLVNSLSRKKLVRRTKDTEDHRKTRVTLTEKGILALREVKKMRGKLIQKMFDALSENELKELSGIQKKIIGRLSSQRR